MATSRGRGARLRRLERRGWRLVEAGPATSDPTDMRLRIWDHRTSETLWIGEDPVSGPFDVKGQAELDRIIRELDPDGTWKFLT